MSKRAFKHEATDRSADTIKLLKEMGQLGYLLETKHGTIKVERPVPEDAPEGTKPEVITERDDNDPSVAAAKAALKEIRGKVHALVARMDENTDLFGTPKVFSPDRG